MNKYLVLLMLLLSGCSSTGLVSHREQLLLNIPNELLEAPQPLNKL